MQITPVELVLRCATATIGVSETPEGSNAGPFVERALKICGLPKGNPWCAAGVALVGTVALGQGWPLPKTASCQELYLYALNHRLVQTTPAVGDVFVMWYEKLKRYAHTGFIVQVYGDGSCQTLEYNTSDPSKPATREGWVGTNRVRRFAEKDRFIRWTDALPAGA